MASGIAELRETAATRLAALTAAKRWDEVGELIARVEPLAEETPILAPTMAQARGLAAAAQGKRADAVEALRQAVAGFERIGHRFLMARAREALAELVGDDEALALHRDALAIYEELGALPHAVRVRSSLAGMNAAR